ncbi:hypothetical protein DLAC_06080 [Tieghemostelium lacteum]|uniref:Uncharacterized protein n=1 Tax=Tieghemostelium lacteum TaxID=361077 RepID=A0A151ZHK1_TIELA|nr:hypothetical protein DLAC_06080 [Tieghemostelium lacteum]|eukprot:KYQ93397.1 hypothetical protein DLAC_06080 [Tieghemostelium lacteum]
MEKNLPLTVLNQIFYYSDYSLKSISSIACVNKYYSEVCQNNIIFKRVYIRRYGERAFEMEKKSRLNIKMVQKKRKDFCRYPPVDEDFKQWYTTVKSIEAFHEIGFFYVDIGSEVVKYFVTKRQGLVHPKLVPTATSVESLTLYHRFQVDKLIEALYSFFVYPKISIDSPMAIAVSPTYFEGKLRDKLETLKKKLPGKFVHFKNSGLIALQLHSLTSGIVVMVGMSSTLIVPFINGVQLKYLEYDMCGAIIRRVAHLGREPTDHVLPESHPQNPINWYRSQKVIENYELRKIHDPSLNDNHEYLAESYFDPHSMRKELSVVYSGYNKETKGKVNLGLVEKVVECLDLNRNNPKASLLQNIVLTGGITAIEGFQNRFQNAITQLRPSVKVHYTDTPIFDVINGLYLDSCQTESLHDIYQI